MRKRTSWMVLAGLLAALPGSAVVTPAQEPPADEPAAVPAEETPQQHRMPFALYVAVAGGQASAQPFNTSIITRQARDEAQSSFKLDNQLQARASIGWKLAEGKGDFRLDYKGYREDHYELNSTGLSSKIISSGIGSDLITPLVQWWTVSIKNGALLAERTPLTWVQSIDDADHDTNIDRNEIRVLPVDRVISQRVPSSLNNHVQTLDLLYGREFGGRRYNSRWWGGLRYFDYQGQMLATAWLAFDGAAKGTGFTDGDFLKLLAMSQKASGFGPTGAWEVHFNFFEKKLALYLRGQAAFVLSSIEADSGPFFTLVNDDGAFIAPARLQVKRDKSVWQNTGELGARLNLLREHLQLELGWSLTGYLDTVILPSVIVIPESVNTSDDGVSALYGTQDYKVEGWHFGLAYQF